MDSIRTIYLSLLTVASFFFCPDLAAEENPFLRMSEKPYGEYWQEVDRIYTEFTTLDTFETATIVRQLKETAQITGSVYWELEAGCFEIAYDVKCLGGQVKPAIKELLQRGLFLLDKAKEENVPAIECRVRYHLIKANWEYLENYEFAIEQCVEQEKRLKEFSAEEVPDKIRYYLQIAYAYLFFKDYSTSMHYFRKILGEKECPYFKLEYQAARSGIGLCYRRGWSNYDSSDYYFTAVLQAQYPKEKESSRNFWTGFAEGSIGRNLFHRGKYDQAIPLLKSSIAKIQKSDNEGYASGPAATLAEIYLKKGNIKEAKRYIDSAKEYYDQMPGNGRLSQIYKVMAKHYAATSNDALSSAYIDSTLSERKRHDQQYNSILLLRTKEKESMQRQQALILEKEKRQQAHTRSMILFIGFLFLACLLTLVLVLYRRKREAHRKLVHKSQEWAKIKNLATEQKKVPEAEEHCLRSSEAPDEATLFIMKQIEQLISEERLYQDSALSIDSLSQRLDFKRHYISNSINRCTGKSFNTFVNEYRVKEAIRLLSESGHDGFSIDRVAFDSGFNDRKNFYRVFKKMTGLSPSEFKKNLKER